MPLSTLEASDNCPEPTSKKLQTARRCRVSKSVVQPCRGPRCRRAAGVLLASYGWLTMAGHRKLTAGAINTFWQTSSCKQSARYHWTILSRSIGMRKPKRGLMHSVARPEYFWCVWDHRKGKKIGKEKKRKVD